MGVHVAPIGIISFLCAFVNPFRKSNLIIPLSPLFHSIYALHGSPHQNNPNLGEDPKFGLFFARDFFGMIVRFE